MWGQDPSTGSEHVRTPFEIKRDFADAQSSRGGFRLRLNLPTWFEYRICNKKAGCNFLKATPAFFMVRPAGFEPAAYGFEVRTSDFPNLLKLLQQTEIVYYIFPRFF